MEKFDQPLTPREREQLDQGIKRAEMPPHLYNNIIKAMKSEGLIRERSPLIARTPLGIATTLVLALVLAGAGFWAGKSLSAPAAAPLASGKPAYLLLVHNDDTPAPDPEQQVAEYGNWLQQIQSDRKADGEHLYPNGWVITAAAAEAREAFPGRNEVGGYFLFEAADDNEAVRIARSCPHLKYNGTLELRQLYR